ncbi:hypothetical protein C5S31_00800, partial [ANME-1 cluster archaeon GoMg2]|nr:hypothetical protein [ANME-1 cluster archaeon GoMg2]
GCLFVGFCVFLVLKCNDLFVGQPLSFKEKVSCGNMYNLWLAKQALNIYLCLLTLFSFAYVMGGINMSAIIVD